MELVKLYYRIGEVAQIVGVQPHVLRYWETEFRTIRPQKSGKGQRVYSRKDVEKLLRVKDLLKNQGFTIAGAKKKLRDPSDQAEARATPDVTPLADPREGPGAAPERFMTVPTPVVGPAPAPSSVVSLAPAAVPAPLALPTPTTVTSAPVFAPAPVYSPAPVAEPLYIPQMPQVSLRERAAYQNQAKVREALLSIREEIVAMLGDFDRAPPRRPKLPTIG